MTGAQRYGVISDVHANLYALQTTLEHLRAARVDGIINLGDAIGYGPHPNECLDMLEAVDPISVTGNHEQVVLGRLSPDGCTDMARRSLEWTGKELTSRARAMVGEWPLTVVAPGLLVAHGSPERVDEYVRSDSRARQLLDHLATEHPSARALLLGHTHEAWAYSRQHGTQLRGRPGRVTLELSSPYLVNPGSVGQSRDRRAHARFAILDLAKGVVDFHSVPYDARACIRALKERGLPAEWCHVAPPIHRRAKGIAGDSLRRLGLR